MYIRNDDYQYEELQVCKSLENAQDYIRGREGPLFSKEKDGAWHGFTVARSYRVEEKEVR